VRVRSPSWTLTNISQVENLSKSHKELLHRSSSPSSTPFGIEGKILDPGIPRSHKPYSPYPVHWGFLPEWALLVKDTVRHYVVGASQRAADHDYSRALWLATRGRRTLRAVQTAAILFVHAPKTAGTSISRILYGRNLPHYTAEFYRRTFGASLSGIPSFSIVREPVERFLSAYRYIASGGTDIMLCDRFERSRLAGLNDVNFFIDFLLEDPRRLALSSPVHSQAEYVMDSRGNILVDRLYALDSTGLSSDLLDWLGIRTIPRINASRLAGTELTRDARRKILDLYAEDAKLYEMVTQNGGSWINTQNAFDMSIA